MKTLLSIATLLLCISQYSYSQNISIAEFLQLRGQNNNAIESRLASMKFDLYDQDEIGSGKTQYTFQNNNTNSTLQWVDFVYAQDAQWNNRISFQIQNIELVKEYLTEIKNLGFHFSNKKVVDRQIYEVYTNAVYRNS